MHIQYSKSMRKLVAEFPLQIEEAMAIAQCAELRPCERHFENVIITGLGGSGIGGSIVSQLTAGELNLPVYVNKDYRLPHFCSEKSLVIVCSYSGNTEETLSAFDEAKTKGAEIACVSSGGELLSLAQSSGINYIQIPGTFPPRAAIGYSLVQLLRLLEHYGLIGNENFKNLKQAPGFVRDEEEQIAEIAESIATAFLGSIPILYTAAAREGIAIRFRQQLNENSKMLCWHHVYPEMTHNELVGWASRNDQLSVLFMRSESDHPRTKKRMDISKAIYSQYTDRILEVYAKGANEIEKSLYLIHLGDWVSVLLAEKKGIDPVEVDVISHLKSELAKFEG